MIVKCEQCQTRFKIPDERVSDKGVKVRCTKCQHLFRVTKDMAQPAPAPPRAASFPPPLTTPPQADPFARFGAPSDATSHEETRPGHFALGVEASKIPDLRFTAPEPTQPSPPPTKPFDFSTLAPTVPAAPSPMVPKKPPPPRASPVVPPLASRPAFHFTALPPEAPTVPEAMAPPAPAPVMPAKSGAPQPAQFDFSAIAPGAGPKPAPSAPFDFGGLPSNPSPPVPQRSSGPSPFDFSGLSPHAGGPAPGGVAFDFGTLGPTTTPLPPGPLSPEADPGPTPAFDFSALAPVAPSSAPPVDSRQSPASSLFADVPDLNEPSLGHASTIEPPNVPDDFFATPAASAASNAPGSYRAGPSSHELFEETGSGPVPAVDLTAPTFAPQVVAPAGGGAAEAGKGRSALGVIVNLGVAVVLVAAFIVVGSGFLNDGKLDKSTFSPERLKALVSSHHEFDVTDISNGLYDTLSGKPVFYVRGDITNQSATATKVRVRAEILDGETTVRVAEVTAGAPPTPEQLRNLTGPEELERLQRAISKSAPHVSQGQSASFVVTFYEYPPDLTALRVRVSAHAEPDESVAP